MSQGKVYHVLFSSCMARERARLQPKLLGGVRASVGRMAGSLSALGKRIERQDFTQDVEVRSLKSSIRTWKPKITSLAAGREEAEATA